MKNILLHNWHMFRILRLALGIAILVQGIYAADLMLGIAGALFTLMAIFNTGCCATGSCSTEAAENISAPKTDQVVYEEVVDKK